jgi:diaminopimelate decarboxylase
MATKTVIPRLALFPQTAEVNDKDHLVIGGCDTVALVEEFGTPLYVFDEAGLRSQCRTFKTEFTKRYSDTTVCYSAKAFTASAMLKLIKDEGLDLDVVSGGELGIAHKIGFPMGQVHFPGNNKSAEELEMAVKLGIGHVVVDNPYELDMLTKIAGRRHRPPYAQVQLHRYGGLEIRLYEVDLGRRGGHCAGVSQPERRRFSLPPRFRPF